MLVEIMKLWLLFGLIVYLLRWFECIGKREKIDFVKETWEKHGIKPFVKGLLMIVLGPLLIVFIYLNQKKIDKIEKELNNDEK